MAQVGTANDHVGLDPEKLIEFVDELRRSGFNIGTQQYFAVQDLLILLAAQGRLPAEPEGLKTWLSPILCNSPKEQESFYQEFDRWLKQQRKPKVRSRFIKAREREGAPKSGLRNLLNARMVLAVVICLLMAAGVVVFFKMKKKQAARNSNSPLVTTSPIPLASPDSTQPAIVSQVDRPTIILRALSTSPTPVAPSVAPRRRLIETYLTYFKQIRAGAVGLPFLIVGIWWLRRNYRKQSLLEKWSSTKKPRLDQVTVGGVSARLFRDSAFRRIAQELRRHRLSASSDLDVQPTVGATIRAGGRFTPIYSSRRVSPEYLVLIDRVTFRDQQAQLEDKLISRLVEDNVFVDRYYFHRDPRSCRREDPGAPHLNLRDLAALHPEHYLIVFSDGAGLMNPLSGRPQRWLESFSAWPGRALLTEESIADWGYREWALSGLGFAVLPASKTGLQLLLETINARASQRTMPGDWSQRYPKLVQERPERWLKPSAPELDVVNELCEQLRAFLGDEDYFWLGACAVYPVLQWDLTLYFGIKLTRHEAFEERLLSLVRLPWFRHGVMPDWFRERLISDLPADRESAVRQALSDLLITSLEQPSKGFTLEVARQASRETRAWQTAFGFIGRTTRNRRLKNLLQAWIETEPEHSPLRDYVFLRFVTGSKASKLVVSVPAVLRQVFQPKRATLGLSSVTALLLAVTFALVGWIAMTRTKPSPSPGVQNLPITTVVQPVAITEIYMAKDDESALAGANATSFDQEDETQQCVVKLSAAQPGTRIKFAWKRMEGDKLGATIKDAEYVTAGLEDKVAASLTLPRDDRRGKYVVDASLDGKSSKAVEYNFVSTEQVASQTPAPRSDPLGKWGFELWPDQGMAVANGNSRATFQATFLGVPPTGTKIRISVDGSAKITYQGRELGTQADISLDEGKAISENIDISSSVPGRVQVRARVLPNGDESRAEVIFTAPRPSRIVFEEEPQEIAPTQMTVSISVHMADDSGNPLAADRPVHINFKAADADDPVVFEPSSVVLTPGSFDAKSTLQLKARPPKSEIRLLATSEESGYKFALKSILIRSAIQGVVITGPIEVLRGASAQFTIHLTDKDGKRTVAEWDRKINLSATRGTLSPTQITIPKGQDGAKVQYRSSGSPGKVLLNAESEGLQGSSTAIVVVIAAYWLALSALAGGLVGGILTQIIRRDYRMTRILLMWTGKQWDLGFIGRLLSSAVSALSFYWILKLGLSRALLPILPAALSLDSPIAAFFLGGIAGFASLVVVERLLNLAPKKSPVLPIVLVVLLVLLIGGGVGGYLLLKSKNIVTPGPGPNPDPGEVLIKADLIDIPGGTFQMGRNDSLPSEGPAHEVTLIGFQMDKNEVTNAEYGQFVKQTSHTPPEQWGSPKPPVGQENLPVSNVSYNDAVAFAEWRSKRDGVTYRLPTEEEWEYAARNGDKDNIYPWGNTWQTGRAATAETGVNKEQPVGTYPLGANRWGVQDLMGNVHEWTSSKASLYKGNSGAIQPQYQDWMVVRGGSYGTPSSKVYSTYRDWFAPNHKNPVLGFRLVKVSS